jgi:hypothetical protein
MMVHQFSVFFFFGFLLLRWGGDLGWRFSPGGVIFGLTDFMGSNIKPHHNTRENIPKQHV